MNVSWHKSSRVTLLVLTLCLVIGVALTACGSQSETLTIYSGRTESLVEPLLNQFAEESGVTIQVRYGESAAIAATILEEGRNSPADVVFLQDAGSLGVLQDAQLLGKLPDRILNKVDAKYRSASGVWIGTSGRSRTVVYNTDRVDPQRDLPQSIMDFTDPKWRGRLGWAPTNASFQSFVTALRVRYGEDGARQWLQGVQANAPRAYPNNIATVAAVAAGEIDVGFVNHYYLHQFLAEQGEGFKARNYYFSNGDIGALINTAGVGILATTKRQATAEKFVDFLLAQEEQNYFAKETYEFPLAAGISAAEGVPSLQSLTPPDIDLSSLHDLRGTLNLLREVGLIS